MGGWVLSSMGERSHGQNLKRVLQSGLLKTLRCPLSDTPIIGNGISRNSSDKYENHLNRGGLEWRTVDPDGRRSQTYIANQFYTPKVAEPAVPDVPTTPTVESQDRAKVNVVGGLQSLIEMLQNGTLSRSEFDLAKTSLLRG